MGKHGGFGWRAQEPDQRDREFLPTMGRLDVQETEFELPGVDRIPVLNQGQQGSCTGHGSAGITMFDQQAQGQPIVVPARAMLYFDARIPEGTTDRDSGATIRDVVKGLVKYGVCADADFPYDDRVYDRAPSDANYEAGKQQEAVVYEAVARTHVHQAVASGFPVIIGFTVYESFESEAVARTGVVPVPGKGERVLGGHCVFVWGFNSRRSPAFKRIPPQTNACRNSWGEGWGDHGNFYLPQWFFTSGNASDFWTVRRVGAGR